MSQSRKVIDRYIYWLYAEGPKRLSIARSAMAVDVETRELWRLGARSQVIYL